MSTTIALPCKEVIIRLPIASSAFFGLKFNSSLSVEYIDWWRDL
jgi:hypothetical protein